MPNITKSELVELYEKMLLIRRFEEKANELFVAGLVRGTVHTSNGQEAVAAGICHELATDDYIVSNHRGHGHALAKGADPKFMMAELFGKKTGYCKGMGGSMHVTDVSTGMLGANGVVAAGLPIATGAGLTVKLKGLEKVVVCFFGDGAANHGNFHESVNMAAIWRLPVIYVCENNLYAVSVAHKKACSVDSIAQRAAGYGIPGWSVDGMDVEDIIGAASKAVERARKGEGPSIIECRTYRFLGHSRSDPAFGVYRSKEELEEWKLKDPILTLPKKHKLSSAQLEEISSRVDQILEDAVTFAQESPFPTLEDAAGYLYA